MLAIAALLTVFNRREKTLRCLSRLLDQVTNDHISLEVFMVDDGSSDGTTQSVKEQFPSVNIIYGTGNLFWNRGMYLAWQTAAKYKAFDYYFWINDDTFLLPGALRRLLQTSEEFNQKAIVVGTTSTNNDVTQLTYGGRDKKGRVLAPKDYAIPCNHFNGNIVLVPKFAYELLGPNDPVFHHALGDFDYGKRAYKRGIKMMVAPGVLGTCDAHEVLPDWCNPKISLKKRWTAFRTPLGQNPEELFIYNFRHDGMGKALYNYLTNHLRVILPGLWNIKNLAKINKMSHQS